MALKAEIYKAVLQINDSDRQYYNSHSVTTAQHPSETNERMMMRLTAFALFADDNLKFTKGLSAEDEPELWIKNLTDDIELWIDFGQPEERRVKKACGRSKHVVIICYGRTGPPWWEKNKQKMNCMSNLSVKYFNVSDNDILNSMVDKNMNLQFSIDAGQIWVSTNEKNIEISVENWKETSK